MQCGIVGLPNVGKSTLFNAITKAGIAAENYPFCTIEPNVGIVEVPDCTRHLLCQGLLQEETRALVEQEGIRATFESIRPELPDHRGR